MDGTKTVIDFRWIRLKHRLKITFRSIMLFIINIFRSENNKASNMKKVKPKNIKRRKIKNI
jgi:hypothetical protein